MTSIHGVFCYAAGSFFFEIGWMGLLPFLFSVGGILILIRPVIGHAEDLFGEDYVLARDVVFVKDGLADIAEWRAHLNAWNNELTRREAIVKPKFIKQTPVIKPKKKK